MLVNVSLQFLKWRVVCSSVLKVNDNHKIWNSLFIGFAAGLVTPIRIGEYFGRKIAFGDISLLKVSVSTLLEKLTSLYMILLTGSLVAAFFSYEYYSLIISSLFAIVFLGLLMIVPLLFYYQGKTSSLLNKVENKFSFINQIFTEIRYIKMMGISDITKLILYSFLFYLVILLQYVFLAFAFDSDGSFTNFLIAAILILFIKSIFSFLSFADLGIRESSSVFLLEKMGYAEVVGFNSAIFLFLFNLLIPSIIGVFYLLKPDFKKQYIDELRK